MLGAWGEWDPLGLHSLFHLGSLHTEQPVSHHSERARPVLLGLGDSHGPRPGHAGVLACRQALGREIYFCLDGPTGPSVSIKGPESSPDHLIFV